MFANVGVLGSSAIAAISRRFSAIPASSAGLNSSTFTLSNGGTPPFRPVHLARRMLSLLLAATGGAAEPVADAGGGPDAVRASGGDAQERIARAPAPRKSAFRMRA